MSEMEGQNTFPQQEMASMKPPEGVIGKSQLSRANDILQEYREGKRPVDMRVAEAEKWWMLKQWEVYDQKAGGVAGNPNDRRTATAWLVNAIVGAQADAVEAYPEPVVLPREMNDEQQAKMLTTIMPVILTQNGFEDTYSSALWQKLKSGTAVYGTFWDKDKLNGLGDISIKKISFLNIFYQPGVSDIQQSQNMFHTEMVDREYLMSKYPWLQLEDQSAWAMKAVEAKTEENVRKDDLVEVVDWYYHRNINGKKVLHLCKYVGLTVLYATENDTEPVVDERGVVIKEAPAVAGLYDDGEYPFDFDPLYPMEGSPAGMGMVDFGKGVQENIDRLEHNIVLMALMGSRPRYFSYNNAINIEQFMDWANTPIVDVKGTMNIRESLEQIKTPELSPLYVQVLDGLKNELREVLGATDVSKGTAPGGVVAASALAILDENAGKPKRASTRGTYRAYSRIITRVIERIRQFYDAPRTFRITGDDGSYTFEAFDNSGLQVRPQQGEVDLWERPVFDVEVRAQKQSAYTRMAQNEMAIQFFQMGTFNPQMAEQAKQMIQLMDFKDKEKMLQEIDKGQTLLNLMRQYQEMTVLLTQAFQPQQLEPLLQQIAMTDPEGANQLSANMMAAVDNPAAQQQDAMAGERNEAANVQNARARSQGTTQPA